jgi:hypothetical protein
MIEAPTKPRHDYPPWLAKNNLKDFVEAIRIT